MLLCGKRSSLLSGHGLVPYSALIVPLLFPRSEEKGSPLREVHVAEGLEVGAERIQARLHYEKAEDAANEAFTPLAAGLAPRLTRGYV